LNGAELEAKVKRGQDALSLAGGNAVTICRKVCIASILPDWAVERPVLTITKRGVKLARERDRQQWRAMATELPALKKGLDCLVRRRFGSSRTMERAA